VPYNILNNFCFADELYCPYCPERHFHCGVGEDCIPKENICDGVPNCRNGADEKGCCEFTFIESVPNFWNGVDKKGGWMDI